MNTAKICTTPSPLEHPVHTKTVPCAARPFVLLTDSACDIPQVTIQKWGVQTCYMTYTFAGEAPCDGSNIDLEAFYNRMKAGDTATTAMISIGQFAQVMSNILDTGSDVIYIGLSSGISGTIDSAITAANMVSKTFPNQHVWIVDSLCASSGYGMLVSLAVHLRDAGADAQHVVDALTRARLHICHLFTTDTLEYLYRGGRVSKTSANVAGALNIKPIMHVDNAGKLCALGKAHGRKKAISNIVRLYGQKAMHPERGPVFISHSDCANDAELLARLLLQEYNVSVDMVCEIGPVIGAHSGPGTLALYFLGNER